MRELLDAMVGAVLTALRSRASLVAENLALRQQLAVLRRQTSRPQLRPIDRAFWVVLSRVWSRWADALALVKPATVSGWQANESVSGANGCAPDVMYFSMGMAFVMT